MGVRILHDERADMAALYCSTSDFAFGPVFYGSLKHGKDGAERAEAFLRWINAKSPSVGWSFGRFDVRNITIAADLERFYGEWMAQESDQYQREALAAAEAA